MKRVMIKSPRGAFGRESQKQFIVIILYIIALGAFKIIHSIRIVARIG